MKGIKVGMKHIVSVWKTRNNLGKLHHLFYPENVSSMKSGVFPWKNLMFFPYWFLGPTPNAFLALCSGLQWLSLCCLSSHTAKFVLFHRDCSLFLWDTMSPPATLWHVMEVTWLAEHHQNAAGKTLYTGNHSTTVSFYQCCAAAWLYKRVQLNDESTQTNTAGHVCKAK